MRDRFFRQFEMGKNDDVEKLLEDTSFVEQVSDGIL